MAVIIVTVFLLMSIQAPVFALTEGPALVLVTTPTGQQVSTEILPDISTYDLQFVYRDFDFEAKVKEDMALLYIYKPINDSHKPVWAAIEIASSRFTHGWETCLITWRISHNLQPASQIELKDIQLVQNPPIFGKFFVFEWRNITQAVLYWFESATFQVNSTSQQKYVKMSLIAYPESLEDLSSLENQLVTVATAITSYWEPIKTWAPLALILSQGSPYLAALSSGILIAVILLYVRETRKQMKANTLAYQKLSKSNRQIIETVIETEKTATPTLGIIAATYQNKTGLPIEKEELLSKLLKAEETGIIRSVIASEQDEPTRIWKTRTRMAFF